jgi:hypothetical protein
MTWWRNLAARRLPDVVIGTDDDPYLRRWHVIPRNPIFNVYLHEFVRSDDDRALHDHPWWSVSHTLFGYYREWTFALPKLGQRGGFRRKDRRAGGWVFRSSRLAHRIELPHGRACWTLFITGPKLRDWGFHCPRGWVPWQIFTSDNGRTVGRGCGS